MNKIWELITGGDGRLDWQDAVKIISCATLAVCAGRYMASGVFEGETFITLSAVIGGTTFAQKGQGLMKKREKKDDTSTS